MKFINKIISGAQTGADRAGLDFAINNSIPHGGWVPKGRLAEDGVVPEKYKVTESKSEKYPPRTAANIHDSDATLIFTGNKPDKGTLLTIKLCQSMNKPCLVVNIEEAGAVNKITDWMKSVKPGVLNIAGNRESFLPGIHGKVFEILQAVRDALE